MFHYSAKHDLAVAQIPKAGLMSIGEWLGSEFAVVKNDAARAASRRVAFIRHPLERLKSAYSFLAWHSVNGRPHVSNAPVNYWESFVDHVLAVNPDEHWLPQSKHVEDVPTCIRRFESLPDCHAEFWPGPFPHLNRVIRLETTDYREAELMDFYRDDLAMWNGAH